MELSPVKLESSFTIDSEKGTREGSPQEESRLYVIK
jgi:hypothetical protein